MKKEQLKPMIGLLAILSSIFPAFTYAENVLPSVNPAHLLQAKENKGSLITEPALHSEALITPKETIQLLFTKITFLKSTLDRGDGISENEKEQKSQYETWISNILDYQEISKLSLGKHWDDLNISEREAFVALLTELIQRTSLKQLKSYSERAMHYISEQITDNQATLITSVAGDEVDIMVEYRLRVQSNRWLIYDLIIDDISLVQNYRTQFHRIISSDSYSVLLEKMQKRLAELQKETAQL